MRPESKRLLIAVVIPLAVASAWLQWRTPHGNAPATPAALPASPAAARATAEQAADALATQLAQAPDNPPAWAMLGAAQARLGRWDAAAAAFARVGPSLKTRPDWLAAAAEVDFHRAGQRFTDDARAHIAQALALDPRHPQALTLAASDAMQREAWSEAIALWDRLAPLLPADGSDRDAVDAARSQARQRAAR